MHTVADNAVRTAPIVSVIGTLVITRMRELIRSQRGVRVQDLETASHASFTGLSRIPASRGTNFDDIIRIHSAIPACANYQREIRRDALTENRNFFQNRHG